MLNNCCLILVMTPFKLFAAAVLSFIIPFTTHSAHAGLSKKTTAVFDPECNNYCAFSEFEPRCSGVRFKVTTTKNDTTDTETVYTIWNEVLQACTSVKKFPKILSIKTNKIKAACQCEAPTAVLPDPHGPITDASKQKLVELKSHIENWSMCAPNPLTLKPNSLLQPFLPNQVESCVSMKQKGQQGYMIMGGCNDQQLYNCNYYPNTNNLAGVFCATGDEDRCEDVRKSQDPVTGAWYRNAYQRIYPNSEQGQPLFSRDEVLGVLFYLAHKKDKTAAQKWLQFIERNPTKNSFIWETVLERLKLSTPKRAKKIQILDFCPPRPKEKPEGISDAAWVEMQSDDRCEMRPTTWGTMYQVYRYMGFTDADLKKMAPTVFKKLKANQNLAAAGTQLFSHTTPAVGGGAYQTALLVSNNWLLQIVGQDNPTLQQAQKVLNRRSGYISPYFHYQAENRRATEFGAYLIQKYCPVTMPYAGPLPGGGVAYPAASFFDMGMRSFGGLNEYGIQSTPTGHDCLAWIRLYVKGYPTTD
jgi:hypothetical protein